MQRSSTAERGSGRGRQLISSIVSVAMAAAVGVIATPEQVRAAGPEEQAISDGLEEVMAALTGLDDLDELGQALPLSDLLPTGADGLDLVEALNDVITGLDSGFADGELEEHLDALSGPVGGGVVADVDATVSGNTVTFETLTLQRAISAPLVFQEAGIDLAGGTLTGNLQLDLSGLVVDLDTTGTPQLFIPFPAATGHVTADLAVDFGPTGVDIRLGILDVHVTGSGAAAVDFSVDLLDPDGDGRLDLTELTTSAPLDLFNVQYASSSASLDAALSVAAGSLLDTPLLAPSLTGSIHYSDDDLSNGFVDGVDTLEFDAPELPNFAEMGPEQILVAIAQLAVALQSMQTRVGNTGVPLLGSVAGQDTSVEDLADLIDVNEQIGQFFIDQGLSTPESPFELKIGDVDGDGIPDVDLEALGLDTIDGIIAALATYLGDAADLDYDPPTNGLTFDLAFSDTFTPPPAVVKINDQLAELGLRGVVSSPGAGISLAADYTVDVTFGVDLSDFSLDDPITDRLYIETDGVEVSGNATVNGDLDLGGTIGFLEVALADTDADAGAAGYVPLLAKREGDTDPMLQLDLVGGTDGRVTLSDLYSSLGSLDADLVDNVFTLDAADFDVVGTINAAVPPTTLAASATVGSTDIASASFTFGWPDILNAEPEFTGDHSAFTDNFSSFDFDTENPLALFNQIVDAIDTGLAALDNLGASGDPQNPGVLDEELPLIGASPRDAVAFIGEVRDAVNEIAQDPSGSLQKLEIQLEVAIAEALGIDLSALGEMPDANDAAFILDSGTPGDPSDDVFDTAGFQLAIDQYLAQLQAFLAGNDFVDLQWVAGNSPGDIIITLNLGVCSDKSDQVGHPGCTHEIPLESSFNFDTSDLGDFAGIVAAEGGGTVALDYNAAVTLGIGVELPDVDAGEVPKPFITDDSGIDLRIAGMFDGSFGATIGPFAISVGSTNTPTEDCTNDLDDDGDGFVNDGCPPVGETAESDAQCANATDDDATDDDESDGATDGTPSVVNDGCPGVTTEMTAKAGAVAELRGTVTDGRAYLFPEAGEPGLPELLGSIDLSNAFQPNPLVDCGNGAMIACGRLPLFVNTGGATDTPLGAASLQIDGDFNVTFGPPNFFDQVLANLEAAGADLLWALIGTGLIEFGQFIDESTTAAAYDVEVPVVGDILDGGAEIAGAFNDGIATPLGTFFQSFNPTDLTQLTTGLETGIFDAINAVPGAAVLLEDRDGSGGPNAGDIEVTAFCGNAECTAADPLLAVTDTRVEFGLGEVIAAADPIPFDFGVPGLRLATQDGDGDGVADGVEAAVTWSIDVGFGLSEGEGFYLYTGNAGDPEISVDVTVDVPDLSADIAFLGVEVDGDAAKPAGRNQVEELVLGLAIDLPAVVDGKLPLAQLGNVDPAELLPTLTANVDLWWPILTAPEFGGSSAGDGTLPTVHAVLDLTWNASLGVAGFDFGDLDLGFQQVQLDLGSFVSDFLEPVLGEVQTFTKPLQPIIDTVTAPIPGVSQLAELVGADPVTMLDLFEAISQNDLTLIRTLLDVITFVNAIAGLGSSADGILIDIGSFQVSGEQLGEAELPANQKDTLITSETLETGSIVDAINSELDAAFASVFSDNLADGEEFSDDEPGFTFPAFEDLSSIFDLLVGKDVTLIRFASGPLKAEFGWSQSFGPIAVGPVPVSIVISGSASIQGRFAVGYDTKGVRQLVQAITADDGPDVSFLQGFGFLFNGLFLDDLNAAGQDVPEIRLVVEFAAGAAVDLVVVSAGVEGGVRATLDLNLHDGGFFEPIPPANLDGKLRLDEIASFLFNNPICLFDVSGKLEAFIRIFVEIDLFLFSARFEFTVVNITLLELKNITAELCQPPEPVLAKKFGSTLVLHTGPYATHRNFAEDEPAEKYTVRAVDTDGDHVADAVKVTAFGFEETHAGITKVVGDFGTPGETTDDKDQVRFDAGSNEAVDGAGNVVTTAVPFTIATEVCGGPGDDKFYGGDGADVLVGDGGSNGTYGEGFACTTGDAATDGADELTGNGGVDTLWGNGGADVLGGGSGGDAIHAGPGADQANGDIGGDTIDGGDGDDILRGGADVDPTSDADPDTGGVQAWPAGISDDVIAGGPGIDTIDGDFGDDTISGGTENDTIVGGFGADTIDGDAGEDTIFGNDGDDPWLSGGPGDDVILGMLGDDTIRGGPGHDNLIGNDGDDDIDGEEGLDIILGDNGSINRAPLQGDLLPTDPNLPLVTLVASSGGTGDTDLNGGPDADVIYGQEGADTMNGGGGDDRMFGAAGVDTMAGDAGADTMFGDNDSDVMYGDDASGSNGCADLDDDIRGGSGDDLIEGNADADRIFGDSGDDVIYGDAETPGACDLGDIIRGNGDSDRVWGNADGDVINGDGGVDRLVGGGRHAGETDGSDLVHGDAGDDVIAGDNADIADGGGTPATFDVTTFLDAQGTGDVLFGDAGTDRIFGQHGGDAISGGADQDFLEGNADSDVIAGDGGDDRISGGSSMRSTIDDGDGTPRPYDQAPDAGDAINGGAGDDVIAGDNAEIAGDGTTLMTAFNGFGVFGADVVHGNDGDDRIYGQLGGDLLHGDDGADYVVGDLGFIDAAPDVTLPQWPGGAPNYGVDLDAPDPERVGNGDLAGGADEIRGGGGDDHLFGGVGNDLIEGNADDDYMEGNNGDDSMFGNALGLELGDDQDDMIGGSSSFTRDDDVRLDGGENLMQGNGDHDVLLGDNGDIERVVDAIDDTVWATDEVIPGARKRIVTLLDRDKSDLGAVSGPDHLQGNTGSDRMYGEGDADLVQGNAGDDLIEGNQGADWLEGNAGEDDIIGGSSLLASAGGLPDGDPADDPTDLGDPDAGDAIFGGADADVIAGDNAVVVRKTDGNGVAYAAALASAYHTTDPQDAVPGWWLGVSTHRLVTLLDRTEPITGRYGVDIVHAGSGADVAFGQDGSDWMSGGADDDVLEGNGGADDLYGDRAPEASETVVPMYLPGDRDWLSLGLVSAGTERDGAAAPAGEDDIVGGSNEPHRDGNDTVRGDGEDDFVLGDNGTLRRWIDGTGTAYRGHVGDGARERVFRIADQLTPASPAHQHGDDALDGNDGDDAIWGQDGDDLIRGQAGDDDLIGELGDDTVYGGTGEDAMVGDRGSILNSELGDPNALFAQAPSVGDYNGPPFLTGVAYFVTDRFDRRVDLRLDVVGSVGGPFPGSAGPPAQLAQPGILTGGDDVMRGGPGHDSMHGAWGDDLMNGDEGGDWLFGSHGSDVMWGGYGDAAGSADLGDDYVHVDRLFGGRGGDPANDAGVVTGGADILDYKPRTMTDGGHDDPQAWHDAIAPYDDGDGGGATEPQHHQGTDWIYGGWDRDVMQGNVTDPGPNAGDRMWDWTGAFNLYTHCDPDYGGFNDQRTRSPQMEQFLELLAFDSGAGSSIADVRNSSSSAYQELGLVYKQDTKDNNGKAYPTTPGHFDEIAGCGEEPDVP